MSINIEAKYSRGCVVVDLNAIEHNMNVMHKHLNNDTKIIAVIKTDGYGHGSIQIARKLEKIPFVYGFAVATAEEAFELREAKILLPIIILGYTFPYSYEKMIEEDISPCVFKMDMAESLSNIAKKLYKKSKVHIKVDTGMGRIGIMPDEEGLQFVENVQRLEGIEIEGIFTHFARADEEDKSCATRQFKCFQRFLEQIEQKVPLTKVIKHCSNSAGILSMQEVHMDVVRAGITLYGLSPSKEVNTSILPLKKALAFYSTIVYIKWIDEGYPISYGGTYVTKRRTRVATIPIGYGDGYPRSLSNKGFVLIRGKRAPIIGRICMDQFMVDVTDLPDVTESDRATLIGCDGEDCITVEELSELSGRFDYEFVCNIGKRVPRIYIGEN